MRRILKQPMNGPGEYCCICNIRLRLNADSCDNCGAPREGARKEKVLVAHKVPQEKAKRKPRAICRRGGEGHEQILIGMLELFATTLRELSERKGG